MGYSIQPHEFEFSNSYQEEWHLPEFWPFIANPGILWDVAQLFVFLPQTCQEHDRTQL